MTEQQAIDSIMGALPAGARVHLQDISIELADHPSRVDLERGADPQHVGYFWGTRPGDDGADGEAGVLPPADERPAGVIRLFRANIAPVTLERLRAALLHEIAHALGHDEEEIRGVLGYVMQC